MAEVGVHARIHLASDAEDFFLPFFGVLGISVADVEVEKDYQAQNWTEVGGNCHLGHTINHCVADPFEASPEVLVAPVDVRSEIPHDLRHRSHIKVEVHWSIHHLLDDQFEHGCAELRSNVEFGKVTDHVQ